jgi:hypothetical protein
LLLLIFFMKGENDDDESFRIKRLFRRKSKTRLDYSVVLPVVVVSPPE